MGTKEKSVCSSSSFFFIANLLNFVLATAVFTIPFPMYEVGIVLGSIILSIICFVSVIACTLIIEALAMKNYLTKMEFLVLEAASEPEVKENITPKEDDDKDDNDNNGSKDSDSDQKDENSKDKNDSNDIIDESNSNTDEPLIDDDIEKAKDSDKSTNLDDNNDLPKEEVVKANLKEKDEKDIEENIGEEADDFYIRKRYEISKISKLLIKPLYFFVVLTIICYLYVGVTSNSIIAGNNLRDIIGMTIRGKPLDNIYYRPIVGGFFFLTICIALNNINHLKKLSMFIMIMRFLIIGLIMGSCIYSMIKYGVTKLEKIPKINTSNITVMIGNSLFVFMSHHSIPGMVEGFSPQKHLMKLLMLGYFCSLLFLFLYSYVALFAFGNPEFGCDEKFPTGIRATFSSNFLKLPYVGYIINYYPILNVITSGMQLITLRNNILEAIGGCSPSLQKKLDLSEETGFVSYVYKFLFNLVVAIPPIMIGLMMQNIQTLMKYFSSILGFLLMLIVPIVIAFNYRKFFKKRRYKEGKLNKSFLRSCVGYFFIIFMSILLISLIIYGFVLNIKAKNCVFESNNYCSQQIGNK